MHSMRRSIIYKVILIVSFILYIVISLSVSETGLKFSDMFSSFSEEWGITISEGYPDIG